MTTLDENRPSPVPTYTIVVFHKDDVSRQDKLKMLVDNKAPWRGLSGIVKGKFESVGEWDKRLKQHLRPNNCWCSIWINQGGRHPLGSGFLCGLGETAFESINDWKHRISYWLEQHPEFSDWPEPASIAALPSENVLKMFKWTPPTRSCKERKEPICVGGHHMGA